MRILLRVAEGRDGSYLVSSLKPASAVAILRLIEAGQYSKAIVAALSGGGRVEELGSKDSKAVRADLVITRQSAHWDLCGK
jgi:hypothetical protein